jgi:hypothetical protein
LVIALDLIHRVIRKVPVEDMDEAWVEAEEWDEAWAVVVDFMPDGGLDIRPLAREVSGTTRTESIRKKRSVCSSRRWMLLNVPERQLKCVWASLAKIKRCSHIRWLNCVSTVIERNIIPGY